MAGTVKNTAIRIILILLEILAASAFVISYPCFNAGNIAGFSFFALLLLITLFWNKLELFRKTRIGKVITVWCCIPDCRFLLCGFSFSRDDQGMS